jgi:hypothetical protein
MQAPKMLERSELDERSEHPGASNTKALSGRSTCRNVVTMITQCPQTCQPLPVYDDPNLEGLDAWTAAARSCPEYQWPIENWPHTKCE